MSLLNTIQSAASSLSVFDKAMETIQSNVTNASVPNYTAQTPALASTWTGVALKGNVDARNSYAEQVVWDTSQSLGQATALSDNLSIIQSQFDVSGSGGIPGALSQLYSAFSAWGTSPTDSTARNQVLVSARQVIQAFNQAAASLQQSSQQIDSQLSNTVSQINAIQTKIVAINVQISNHGGTNPSLQAQLYNQLQQLSQYAAISVHMESNGTATVLMNGQVPLVVGSTASPLQVVYPTSGSATYATAPANAQITSTGGQDVTSAAAAGGQLAGLLEIRNSSIPSLIGNQSQQGSLNELAKAFADQVNAILTSGQTSSGAAGPALFTYNASSPTSIASSLSVDPTVTPSDLGAIQPGPPQVANGIPNQLAALANTPQIAGSSFTDFYSNLVADLGTQASTAADNKTNQTDQLTQAESLRSNVSGISLNEQAALLLQYQQAYQASTQLVTTINSLMTDLMNMMQTTA